MGTAGEPDGRFFVLVVVVFVMVVDARDGSRARLRIGNAGGKDRVHCIEPDG